MYFAWHFSIENDSLNWGVVWGNEDENVQKKNKTELEFVCYTKI